MADDETAAAEKDETPDRQDGTGAPEDPEAEHAAEAPPVDEAVRGLQKAVYNLFLGQVDQRGSTFGMGEERLGGRVHAVTGRFRTTVIEEAVAGYASPGACHEKARGWLAADRVVVTTGGRGIGKRAGALVLLRGVLGPAGVIVALPPSISLRDLARRDYQAGYGYAVLDRVGGDRYGAEDDHAWLSVADRVREAGAYMVVTIVDEVARVGDSVRSVMWRAPDIAEVLRARLGEAATDEVVQDVAARMPAGFAMCDLVQIARLLAEGRAPDEAVAGVLDEAGREKVRQWFKGDPAPEQVVKVTVLAFVPLIVERHFEACARVLEGILVPDAGAEGEEPRVLAQDRRREDDLVRVVQVSDGASSRRALAFREGAYRRYVLAELTGRYGNVFWDAVRVWLDRLVLEDDERVRLSIASALALLAYHDRDETEAYLDRWSRGEAGGQGQATAVYILWYLCLDEAMVPIAQRIAEDWAGQGTGKQRLAAIQAFAGELGVRLPHLGARRLWQLVRQENAYSEPAAEAFGELFGTLVVREGDAEPLVEHLGIQFRQYEPVGPTRNRYRLTLVAVLAVLQARSARNGAPAIVEYLRDHHERLPGVAVLWATALRFRPCRRVALEALLRALSALTRLNGVDAEREARALGDALGAALPPEEHALLRVDFLALLTHAQTGAARAQNLGEIMLAALDRAAEILKRRP